VAIPPEERLAALLGPTGGSLALAESCTGGLIAHRVTQVPGSSAYFECGVVSYSNRSKTRLLCVPPELLAEHGAVSEACARAMLDGLLAATSARLGAAVTGVAGPSGGSPEKPVGTVWVAWGSPGRVRTERLRLGGDRAAVKAAAADAVLERLVRAAEEGG
jgi:nicotinamide-nucleotide amidase